MAAIVVKSGFWNDTYAFKDGNHPMEKAVKRIMRRRGMGSTQQLMVALLGAAAGGTASKTYNRVDANGTASAVTSVGSMGGQRTIVTRTQINRATTAADVTRLKNLIQVAFHRSSQTHDASGNGK